MFASHVRWPRRWPLIVVVVSAVAAIMVGAPAVSAAATIDFTGQFSPASLPEGTSFALDDDQVTSFSALLRPTGCVSPSDWRSDSDAVFPTWHWRPARTSS